MSNTSATGGYLIPEVLPAPLEDAALDDFLQTVLVGVTGLDPTLVRPRWQEIVPDLPDRSVDWCGFGVISRKSDTFAYIGHDGLLSQAEGADLLQRHEELNLRASFYGPNCQYYGTLLRDGLEIPQNREQLFLAGMGLVSVGDVERAPELVKNIWLSRADLPIVIRRQVLREYPVLNLLSMQGTLATPAITVPLAT